MLVNESNYSFLAPIAREYWKGVNEMTYVNTPATAKLREFLLQKNDKLSNVALIEMLMTEDKIVVEPYKLSKEERDAHPATDGKSVNANKEISKYFKKGEFGADEYTEKQFKITMLKQASKTKVTPETKKAAEDLIKNKEGFFKKIGNGLKSYYEKLVKFAKENKILTASVVVVIFGLVILAYLKMKNKLNTYKLLRNILIGAVTAGALTSLIMFIMKFVKGGEKKEEAKETSKEAAWMLY